jgi:zinc protease
MAYHARHKLCMINSFCRIFASFSLLLLAAPQLSAKQQSNNAAFERTPAWNADTSDMVADDRIIYGRLKNGLRYAIRPNAKPENQILVRMGVDFGSAAEAEDEQGLAHFVEHMAFNGSTNVPEGEMVRILERLGLSFGADTNASTGFLKTTYMLDLPRKDPALFERALFLMRETASEIVFNPDAVQRERGVVLSEMRDGENFNFKRMRESFRLFYPDTFYANRFPIGKKEVLESASAAQMKALYQKWYTPDRTRIVVVGPVDPAAIEREIVRKFSSWKGNGAQLGPLNQCTLDPDRPAEAKLFVHPEVNEQMNVEQMLPDRQRDDTVENNLMMLRMQIGWGIISDRLSRRSRKEDIPYLYAAPNFEAGFCKKYARVGFIAGSKDGGWQTVLPIVEQTIRQALEHGFTQTELNEQMKRFDASFANAVRSEPTVTSGHFANELAGNEHEVISSAAYRQLAWLQLKPFMTEQSIRAELHKWYAKLDRPQIFLSTRKGDGLTSDQLLENFNTSKKIVVAAPPVRENVSWAYTDFGQTGKIAYDKRIDDLGIRTVRFENGVLLNIKKTDFEADNVRLNVNIDGGRMQFGNDALPLMTLMNGAYASGGLGKHAIDDLRAILAGTTVDTNFSVSEENFISSANIVPKDLQLQLQLVTALITDPGYREEAVRLFRRPLPETYAQLDATPGSALGRGQNQLLYDGDPRFNILPIETVMAAEFDALKTLISDPLKNNRIEVGIVGNIDEDQAIKWVSETLGALSPRKAKSVIDPKARLIKNSERTSVHDFTHRGEANQLAWQRVWKTTDNKDLKLTQTMALLSDIVQIRLLDELREKLGASYSANASSSMWESYPDVGYFSVATNGDPKNAEIIAQTVDSVIAEILEKPVQADLFERARKPTLESYRDWRKRNGTWATYVNEAQTKPGKLDRYRLHEDSFRSITAEDTWKAAQRFLKEKPYTFRAFPKEKAN